jgi:hypothetical protein
VASDEDGTVPPNGWEPPRAADEAGDPEALADVLGQLLALVPEDLRLLLTDAARQLLEALRALIDWCVARLEHRTVDEVEVRDIPIL